MLKGLEVMCSLVCSFQLVYTMAQQVGVMEYFSKRYMPNSKHASPKPTQTIALSIKYASHRNELSREVLERISIGGGNLSICDAARLRSGNGRNEKHCDQRAQECCNISRPRGSVI